MKKQTHRQNGFTLIELMLAMAFLAFVLIFIVVAIFQFIGTYNKGLVYKEINQSGRTIFEDVTRTMRFSSANVNFMDKGRLCVGGQSYVWNTPTTSPVNKYTSGTDIAGIIRVADSAGSLCAGPSPLPNITQAGEVVIARPNITVQSFTAREGDNGRLYSLNLVLGTSGENAPPAGSQECPPGKAGEFCAVASFETNISTRK